MMKAANSSKMGVSRSAEIRARLSHPVIDTDLHAIEFLPVFEDYVDKVGGSKAVDQFRAGTALGRYKSRNWYAMTEEQRRDRHAMRAPWWTLPSENTLDLATVALPRLLHQRLGEQGTDFAILYPNVATFAVLIPREDLRRIMVRAVNLYQADTYRPYADRLTPAAAIPLFTPEEGIEEMEFAVNELGLKVAVITGAVRRPIKDLAARYGGPDHADIASHLTWLDSFGLDSAYDYDPFWAKAVELKMPLTTHTGSMGWTSRASRSNYTFNHIGHFAAASEALVKSLFMSGVTRRFPKLRVGLLEGGAAQGASLYSDLVGHWEKRGAPSIGRYDPARVDEARLFELCRQYADPAMLAHIQSPADARRFIFGTATGGQLDADQQGGLDDFAAAGISKVEDIRDQFIPNFYFGAEADDATVAYAFNTKVNPLGVELKAFWASDSGHWDVPDLRDVLSDTWDLVERGTISEANFHNLVFGNPYEFYAGTNPDFFKNTAVEAKLGKAAAE